MADDRDNPARNSDAARNKAEADSRNQTLPTDTRTWDYSSQLAYENEWNKNKAP